MGHNPDALPVEVWLEISSFVPMESDLVTWLGIAPLTAAENMHDAAFRIIFSGWSFYHTSTKDSVEKVVRKMNRLGNNEPLSRFAKRLTVKQGKGCSHKCRCTEHYSDEEAENALSSAFIFLLPKLVSLQSFEYLKGVTESVVDLIVPTYALSSDVFRLLIQKKETLRNISIANLDPKLFLSIHLLDLSHMTGIESFEVSIHAPLTSSMKLPPYLRSLKITQSAKNEGLSLDLDSSRHHLQHLFYKARSGMDVSFLRPFTSYSELDSLTLHGIRSVTDFTLFPQLRKLTLLSSRPGYFQPLRIPSSLRVLEISDVMSWQTPTRAPFLTLIDISQLTELLLESIDIDTSDIDQIFSSAQNYSSLTALHLREIEPKAAVALAMSQSPTFPKLETLSYSFNLLSQAVISKVLEKQLSAVGHFLSRHASTITKLSLGTDWATFFTHQNHNTCLDDLDHFDDAYRSQPFLDGLRACHSLHSVEFMLWILRDESPMLVDLPLVLPHVRTLQLSMDALRRWKIKPPCADPRKAVAQLARYKSLKHLILYPSDQVPIFGPDAIEETVSSLSDAIPMLETIKVGIWTFEIIRVPGELGGSGSKMISILRQDPR